MGGDRQAAHGGGAGGENGWEQTRRPCRRWRRLGEWVLRDRPPVLELVNKMGGDRKAARENTAQVWRKARKCATEAANDGVIGRATERRQRKAAHGRDGTGATKGREQNAGLEQRRGGATERPAADPANISSWFLRFPAGISETHNLKAADDRATSPRLQDGLLAVFG